MDYNKKLIGQWLELKSPKRATIMRQHILEAAINEWFSFPNEEFARHRERWEYRKLGLRPPIYSMAPQSKPQPIHPIFSFGDSLTEMTNRLMIW